MAVGDPTTGHGWAFAYEQDPTGSPGVFTNVGGLRGSINFPLSLGVTEVTDHGSTISRFVPDGRHLMEPISMGFNFDYASTEHEYGNSGMGALYIARTRFGGRWTGPSANAADIWIMSGYLIQYNQNNDEYSGARMLETQFQPDGPVKIGTVTIT